MNCQSFKNQIDEAAFTAELNRHLEACSDCKTFSQERECLSQLLAKLEHINAPSNFEFGVRAKLNSLPVPANGNRAWTRRFVFASPALAAVAVSAFVFTGYNVFSPSVEPTPVAVQTINPAPMVNALPVVTPTRQILATSNANLQTELQTLPRQTLPVPKQDKQVAVNNGSIKKSSSEQNKADKNSIQGKDIEEPKKTKPMMGVGAPPTPLVQPEFRGKVAPSQVLSIFGIDKISDDGTVESVSSNSAAAERGLLAGDKIETINGQKLAEADLNNSFRQVTLEVLRNGKKRVVTILPK